MSLEKHIFTAMRTFCGYLIADSLHNRPKTSPYLSRFIKVRFGNSSDEYLVPEDRIRRYRKLSRHLNAISTSDALDLQEADSQVGHTFIHFIYSGTYEFLDKSDFTSIEAQGKEFENSILVYSAAIKYDIPELAQLAKDEANKAATDLALSGVIKHARKHFDSIPREEKWLLELMKSLMEERLEKDADTFLKENFFEGFGKHETFDPHLCRFIVELYEKKLFHLAEQVQGNHEKDIEESIHENGVSSEEPDQVPDAGEGDDVPEAKDLENAIDSLSVEEYPPPAPEIVESQTEYRMIELRPATSAIETADALEHNAEIVQNSEADAMWDSWGPRNSSLIARKKSKKGKREPKPPAAAA